MKMIKRFFALTSALVLVASLVIVPVHAEDSLATTGEGWIMPSNGGATAVTPAGIVSISTDFASMLINEIGGGIRDDISSAARWFYSKINEDYCAETENHRHSFVKQHTMVDGIAKNYYVCESCGKSAGEVYDDAYDSYVDDMPLTGIDSEGGFIWYPSFSDLCSDYFLVTSNSSDTVVYKYESGAFEDHIDGTLSFDKIGERSYYVELKEANTGRNWFLINNALAFPYSGNYTRLETSAFSGQFLSYNDEVSESVAFNYTLNSSSYIAGGKSWFSHSYKESDGDFTKDYYGFRGTVSMPVFRVIPDNAPDSTLYTPDTRPGTITGKYLVQNGDAYEDSSTTIINEDDNSIYNPVTNTTTNYDSWSYDYSTRTYTMTDNTNNSVSTVTYGDENITINEGGNTYNVYYGTVINNNDGGDDGGNGGNNSGSGGELIEVPNIDQNQLVQFWNGIKGLFVQLPQMFGDVTEFLRDGWAYVPDEVMTLIEFGLGMVVTVGMINWIFKR